MEEMHRSHKEPAWGWVGVLIAVLDGMPRRRRRVTPARKLAGPVVTPWSQRSPRGWSA